MPNSSPPPPPTEHYLVGSTSTTPITNHHQSSRSPRASCHHVCICGHHNGVIVTRAPQSRNMVYSGATVSEVFLHSPSNPSPPPPVHRHTSAVHCSGSVDTDEHRWSPSHRGVTESHYSNWVRSAFERRRTVGDCCVFFAFSTQPSDQAAQSLPALLSCRASYMMSWFLLVRFSCT